MFISCSKLFFWGVSRYRRHSFPITEPNGDMVGKRGLVKVVSTRRVCNGRVEWYSGMAWPESPEFGAALA
jgi:hypothetical protein